MMRSIVTFVALVLCDYPYYTNNLF